MAKSQFFVCSIDLFATTAVRTVLKVGIKLFLGVWPRLADTIQA